MNLDNDKVGMIVFAGDAFTQLPITSDYISAKMFLESINPSLISKQGTAIGEAINLATRSFTPQEGWDVLSLSSRMVRIMKVAL